MGDRLGRRRWFELGLRRDRDPDREIDAEIEAHLALRVEHLVGQGWERGAARREAERRFGDLAGARKTLAASVRRREGRMRLREWVGSLGEDVRYGWRQAGRAPGFTAVWLATIALGVGLSTAVFAVVEGVLLRPLPFPDSERMMALESVDSTNHAFVVVSADNWDDWRRETRTFEAVAIHWARRVSVASGDASFRATATQAPADFFAVVRPRFLWGRPYSTEETARDERVIVVAERLWQRVAAGRAGPFPLTVDGVERQVIGVVARGQQYPDDAELWIPYRHHQIGGGARNAFNWLGIGRIRSGVTVAAAEADLGRVARQIRERDPVALNSWGVRVTPLLEKLVSASAETLRLVMGAVVLVLLIGCANLASANLARGSVRTREMAVRISLGAGRGRVIRQVLVEHLLLAAIGGALGAGLAWLLARAAGVAAAASLPRASEVVIDARVLGFGVVAAALAGILTGVLPALQAARANPRVMLANGARGTVRGGRGLPGRFLVGFEIAMAVVLVTGALLLVDSLRAVLARGLGFETAGVVTAEVSLRGPRYQQRSRTLDYWDRLLAAVRAVPGVESAGVANWIPLGMGGLSFLEVEGRDQPGAGAGYRAVGEGYFRTLGIPLIAGRDFGAGDDSLAPRVAIVNRALVDRYLRGGAPIGARIRALSMEPAPGGAPWLTVVGVVGNIRHWGYETESEPEVYVAYRQVPGWANAMTLVARSAPGSGALLATVRERALALDPTMPPDVEPFGNRADRVTAERRFTMVVIGAFGIVALGLASIGVYGVLSFAVAQRTGEIALRGALGADRSALVRLVLGSGGTVIAAGVAAGVLGAWLLGSVIRSLLFEVSPRNPLVMAGAALTIVLVSLVAAILPARRAASIDPMVVLRGDSL